MKKLLGIVVLGLLFNTKGYADLRFEKDLKKFLNLSIDKQLSL
jgi:hypothetical protein|tara:strand:+ start:7 stop:135 length:129 start_codon:yes stop_codon:yes gene_type:complete